MKEDENMNKQKKDQKNDNNKDSKSVQYVNVKAFLVHVCKYRDILILINSRVK